MMASGVKRSRGMLRDGLTLMYLEEMANACKNVKFDPPLSQPQAAFLAELQRPFY